jgi:hypothetical protein
MENEVLKDDEVVKFKGEGTAIEQRATALQVVDEETRAQASDMSLIAKAFKKMVKEKFAPAKKAADDAHTAICNLENETIAPANRVIKMLDGKANVYLLEQDRKRAAEQAIIDAETKRREDAERERLLKLAVKQAENGKTEKAEETLQKAEDVFIPAPVLPPVERRTTTESGSTSSRKDFDVFIIDEMAVIRAIASGAILPGAINKLKDKEKVNVIELSITTAAIKKQAEMRRVGNALPVIPGCRVVEKYVQTGRSNAPTRNQEQYN